MAAPDPTSSTAACRGPSWPSLAYCETRPAHNPEGLDPKLLSRRRLWATWTPIEPGTGSAIHPVVRAALPTHDGRVSPVFDTARRLLVVDLEGGGQLDRREEPIDETDPARRALHLARLGVDVLICGAISWPLEACLASAGVSVIAETCGPVEDVLRAFLSGRLTDEAFLMPGCRGRRRRRRRGQGRRTARANARR